MVQEHTKKASRQNLLAALIYFLDIFSLVGIVVSIIFLLTQKKNRFIQFHAAQSVIVFGIIFLLDLALVYLGDSVRLLVAIINIFQLVVWVLLIVKAYQGTMYKLPYIGDLAEDLLKKIG